MRTKIKFYILLITITFISTSCDEHKEDSKSKDKIVETNLTVSKNRVVHDSNIKKIKIKKQKATTLTFTFKNLANQTSVLNVKNDIYSFSNIEQPIVMVNLSATWCPPCRGEVPHLSSLQKKFKKDLFVLTALVHDNIKESKLKKLIISEKAHFFVSTNQEENLKFEKMIIKKLGIVDNFKLPLMVLFAKGRYFTHYEGSMPEEMIESDIKQLLEKMKREK